MRRNRNNKKRSVRGKASNFSGQHLMHNKKIINEILARANINDETVLELGAGKGALTTDLNQKAKRVLAVEYDAEFVDILKQKTFYDTNTKIIHEDILNIRLPREPFVVVSNIPYSITTPIMKMLLTNPSSSFRRGIIVMEKGAAKRFTAKYIKNSYVLVWRMWFDIQYVKSISKYNFSPPPKVDSAMVKITRKKKPYLERREAKAFRGLAEYAMKYPDAKADDVLRGIFTPPQMKHLRKNVKLNYDTTIKSLTEEQWRIVFRTMVQYVQRHFWPKLKNKE